MCAGLCDGPILRPEKSYRVCVIRCNSNPLHLRWVYGKGSDKKERRKWLTCTEALAVWMTAVAVRASSGSNSSILWKSSAQQCHIFTTSSPAERDRKKIRSDAKVNCIKIRSCTLILTILCCISAVMFYLRLVFSPLRTKCNLPNLKTQLVPHSKHTASWL